MEAETLKTEESSNTERGTFEDIYNYNFQDNEKFIEGWRKVRGVIPKEKLYESLVRAEVYFYSRDVTPVDLVGYQKWIKENSREIQNLEDLLSADITVTDDPGNEADNKLKQIDINTETVNDVNNEVKCSDTEKTEEIVAKHPANFMELIEMIQRGMKLPDTDDLNIEPLNVDPTPCDLQRPKKPWEVS